MLLYFAISPIVLPAQAGVIPMLIFVAILANGAPRAGGGDPDIYTGRRVLLSCSPRRRG